MGTIATTGFARTGSRADAARGHHREPDRGQFLTSANEDRPFREVAPRGGEALPGTGGVRDEDARAFPPYLLENDDRVRPAREGTSRGDSDGLAGPERAGERLFGEDLSDDGKRDRVSRVGGGRVGAPKRVAIPGGPHERRDRVRRPHRLGDHPPESGFDRHAIHPCEGPDAREESLASYFQRDQASEGMHLHDPVRASRAPSIHRVAEFCPAVRHSRRS